MSPLTLHNIPDWAAEIAGLEPADSSLPPVFPGVNAALNRLRLAKFITELSRDADLQDLLYLDAVGVAFGLRVTSTGCVDDHPSLATRPFRLWEYTWLYKVLALGQGNLDVLDLGGPASHLVLLSAFADNRVVSLDINPHIVEAGQQCMNMLGLRTMEPRIGDMRDLADIPDGSFDRIVCSSVLEHLTAHDQEQSLGEMARVLRPGGIIGLTFDYGPPAPGANVHLPSPHQPPESPEQVIERYVRRGLHLLGNPELEAPIPGSLFHDANVHYVVGALCLGKPPLAQVFQPRARNHDRAPFPFTQVPDLLPALFRETMSRLEEVHSLRGRLAAADAAVERLTSETHGLREDLRAATSSLGWRAHHWLKIVLPLPTGLTQRAGKASYFPPRLAPKLGALLHHPPKPLEVPRWYSRPLATPKRPARISIVTPCLNNARFLEATILSVLEQQYPDLEYIVQDGGSSDGTACILQRYGPMLGHCESRRDAGQANAINLGFRHATGEIMAYLNADDLLLPGALHYVATFFSWRPEVDVVYGQRVLVDERAQEVGRWVLPPHDAETLSWADYIPQETLFWRRRIWDNAGAYLDESFQFAMDWDLLLRFRDAGARFARLPRFLGAFRVHPQQKTSAQMDGPGVEEMQRLRERCHGRHVSPSEVAHHTRSYLRRHILYDNLYRLGLLRY